MTQDEQIQGIANGVQSVADRLALEGKYMDAALAVSAVQTIRALWTKLNPPQPKPQPTPPDAETENAI